jgi:large subunit ribosomal protein L17
MNKKVFGRKLSRSRPAREALFASLIRGMILSGKIVTTMAKAKAVQGDMEHMITLARKGDIPARRRALAYLDNDKKISDLLFQQIGAFFASRTSGFTRIISLPQRRGDNAKMARIEWTEKVTLKEKEPKVKVKKVKEVKKTEKTEKVAKKEVKKAVKKEVKK